VGLTPSSQHTLSEAISVSAELEACVSVHETSGSATTPCQNGMARLSLLVADISSTIADTGRLSGSLGTHQAGWDGGGSQGKEGSSTTAQVYVTDELFTSFRV